MCLLFCWLQCFSALVHEDDGVDVLTMGCMGQPESAELNCHVGSKTSVAILCCRDLDFCNERLVPEFRVDDSAVSSAGKDPFLII
jgi:hypothetical protein